MSLDQGSGMIIFESILISFESRFIFEAKIGLSLKFFNFSTNSVKHIVELTCLLTFQKPLRRDERRGGDVKAERKWMDDNETSTGRRRRRGTNTKQLLSRLM